MGDTQASSGGIRNQIVVGVIVAILTTVLNGAIAWAFTQVKDLVIINKTQLQSQIEAVVSSRLAINSRAYSAMRLFKDSDWKIKIGPDAEYGFPVSDFGLADGQQAFVVIIADAVQATPTQSPAAGSSIAVEMNLNGERCTKNTDYNYSSGPLKPSVSVVCMTTVSYRDNGKIFKAIMKNSADGNQALIKDATLRVRYFVFLL